LPGQDATKTACRAVKDATSRSCLCGLVEIVELRDLNDMQVDVLVAVPTPEQVQAEAMLSVIPFGRKELRVMQGSLRAPGLYQPELGDESLDVLVANAVVTVWVDQEGPWVAERHTIGPSGGVAAPVGPAH